MHTVDVREGLASQFATRAVQLGASVVRTPRDNLVDAIKTLTTNAVSESVGVTEDLGPLVPEIVELARAVSDWPDTVIGRGRFGIAETGSVAVSETIARDRLMTLLCVQHIVLLDTAEIVATLSHAAELLRRIQASSSHTYVTFVSGPSRTSDIERVLTIGVHGPSLLAVVLVDDWNVSND